MVRLGGVSGDGSLVREREGNTIDQDAVCEGVHSPHIRSPVGMAQAPREWEQAAQQLRHLAPVRERSESGTEDGQDAHAELDGIPKADMED